MQIFYGLAVCFPSEENGNLLFNFEYPYSSIIYAGIVECITLNFFQAIICKLAILGCFLQYMISFDAMSVSFCICFQITEAATRGAL